MKCKRCGTDESRIDGFGRQVEPDWQTRIEKAQRELREYIAELEAERLELRKILGWAYDLDEYKDNPEAPKESEEWN